MIEELLWVLVGIAAGSFTGMVPGIHSNTIAVLAIYSPIEKSVGFALFIVSMSITHSIVEAIPAILLGAPSEESSINLLPGHELLLKGRGLEAIQLTILGAVTAGIFGVLLLPFFFSFVTNFGSSIKFFIPAAILLTIFFLVHDENDRGFALLVTMLAGTVGLLVFNSGLKDAVFVLVIGFFALPGLLQSIFSNTAIPEQQKRVSKKVSISSGFVAALSSSVLAVLPAIGPSQAAVIVKNLVGNLTHEKFLILTGGISTANLVFSIMVFIVLEKTRTGMALALDSIIPADFSLYPMLIATGIAAIGFGAVMAHSAAEFAIGFVKKVDYRKISTLIAFFLFFLVFFSAGFAGVLACLTACSISVAGIAAKVRRSHSMSFLLIPTLLFYLELLF